MRPSNLAAILVAMLYAIGPVNTSAADGACSQPVSSGTAPVASDCLFILRVAVGSESYDPPCVCAPKGTLPTTATDALVCLKAAVGQTVTLDCPCDEDPVLDCERDGYPCSFADVPLDVIERSLELSDEVVAQLEGGQTYEQVGAFLEAQEGMADVTVDGPVVGFRLAGGRPMIVDFEGDQLMLPIVNEAPAAAASSASPMVTARPAAPTSATADDAVLPHVVTGDAPQKHALVLSPFRYEPGHHDIGGEVAGALNDVRGYTGNVTYLATTDELDPQVTVDILTELEEFDVVHIDTHGGTICKKKELATTLEETDPKKDKSKCETGVTDFLVGRFHGTADDLLAISHPGVIHYRGKAHQSIAVTADFFRHYYPQGLSNAVFILDACNTFRDDMADAIAGSTSVYMSWDAYVDSLYILTTSLPLIDFLKRGLTVGDALDRLPTAQSGNEGSAGSLFNATPRGSGGDLRIRDLITVRDNLTGFVVTDTSGIDVIDTPGDGEDDALDLEFTVEGIVPEQLGQYFVNLVINDNVIGHLDMAMSGVQVDDYAFQVSTPVPLPFDAEEGQTLNLDFWVPLPDLGESRYLASPQVAERPEPEVGTEWTLSATTTIQRTDDLTIKSANVTFVLEPGQNPDSDFRWFMAESGTVRIQRDYEDALGCNFSVDETIDITEGAANTYLKFDLSGSSILLDGFGSAPNETAQANSGDCGQSTDVTIGGVYFIAEDAPVSGGSINGGYNDGAQFPTVIEWTLTKVQ